jgi:hypothetical protein
MQVLAFHFEVFESGGWVWALAGWVLASVFAYCLVTREAPISDNFKV